MGSWVSLHGSNIGSLMSALDQKRTFSEVCAMSALPPKADIRRPSYVFGADRSGSLAIFAGPPRLVFGDT